MNFAVVLLRVNYVFTCTSNVKYYLKRSLVACAIIKELFSLYTAENSGSFCFNFDTVLLKFCCRCNKLVGTNVDH